MVISHKNVAQIIIYNYDTYNSSSFFFYREFQLIASALDNNSFLLDQDTNKFLLTVLKARKCFENTRACLDPQF